MSSRRRSSGSGAGRPARSESSTSSAALARRPGSPLAACSSSSQPQDDPPPAWAQQLMAQVAELKSASGDLRREREVGEASDTDTEFARPAHRDQYVANKRLLSVFRHIKANPSKAIELAEKGEELINQRQTLIRIADVDGWDTVRIFQKKPVVDTEADKRRLKEAREQALAARNKANSSRGRSFGKTRARSPRPRRERSPRSSRSPSPAKRTWRSERPFFRTSFRSNDESGSLVCFHCGRHGHFKRSCPHRRGQLGDADGFRPHDRQGARSVRSSDASAGREVQCSVCCRCPGCRFCVGNGSCCKSGRLSREGEARGNVLLALGGIAWNVRVLATVPPGRECCVSRRAARRGVIMSWKT